MVRESAVCSLVAMAPLSHMDLLEIGRGPLMMTLLLFQQIP